MSKSINEEDLNPNKVLESAIHNDNFIDLTDPTATKPSRSTLLPLLSNHDPLPSRKRKLQTFLDSYYEKVDPIPISSSDEEEEVEVVERDPEVNAALDKLKFPIDRLFQQSLKLHQIEGLEFMWDRIYNKRQGCLLAHSMGLGKTLQVISLITTMYQHLQKNPESKFPTGKRILILAPLITLTNWEYEFNKWAVSDAGNFIGEVYNITSVSNFRDERKRYLKYWFTHGGVMLINYDQFRGLLNKKDANDAATLYQYLINPGADIVILDEAHRIKNASSGISTHVKKIRTKSRVCMTGYPLQNHLSEYYYMIDFVAPGLLGSSDEFKAYFGLYIEHCYADSSKAIKAQAAFKLYVLQLLTNHVTHRRDNFILKKDLPTKTEYLVKFKLTPVQHTGYLALLRAPNIKNPLAGLSILRSICNHPKIFESFTLKRNEKRRKDILNNFQEEQEDADFIDDKGVEDVVEEAESYKVIKETIDTDSTEDDEENVFDNWTAQELQWAKRYLDEADIESWKVSGKMSFIVDLANECKLVGDKLVIVSHSIACLDYIQHLFPVFGLKHSRLDGSVVASKRQRIIDEFNTSSDIHVMLLSAKASAIGINVTSANRIILVDQEWNPLYDEQSIGRVYRYGQEKPVFVYRLMTSSTIEERIYIQSVHKRSISRRVIDNKPSSYISKEELVAYFKEPDQDIATIEDMPKDVDWISNSAILQNKEHITKVELLVEDDKDTSLQIVPFHMRDKAKHEALHLLKNWKYKNTISLSS